MSANVLSMIPQPPEENDAKAKALMANAKIMMVDDEPIIMQVLQLHLTAEGYNRFVNVSDSTQAMSVIRVERPSVLLLDLMMPDVSGFDILQMIRADQELCQLPVIVLTASNEPEAKVRALQLGASDFLSKPVDASELALRMKNTIVSRAYEQQLMHFDSLTNLPNRLLFTNLVKKWLSSEAASLKYLTLLLVKIDRFKSINASFGSERGDDLLWAFSQRLQMAFQSSPQAGGDWATTDERVHCIARLSGARFGVLLLLDEPPENDVELNKQLPRLIDTMQEPFMVDLQEVYFSVCVGISAIGHNIQSVESLISSAESAMTTARSSRNQEYVFYTEEMNANTKRSVKMENALRTALANGEISLMFQPKVDVNTGRVAGAEALARWSHAEFGSVSPLEFIPVAESSGVIIALGRWVLESACYQAEKWRQSGHPDFEMSVNVSVRQLHDTDFINMVESVLKTTGLPAKALTVELTENMIMTDVEGNIRQLRLLRELGVKISIDDFGTGYSSLSYLQRFPVDELKIDRSFIQEIESRESNSPIVKAIVSLAHDLDLSVVAEGVEEQVQLDHIRSLGCEEFQGYLRSCPLTIEEFEALLAEDLRKCA